MQLFNADGQTLSSIRPGERGVVRGLRGEHTFCSRAANLGFTTGAQICVIQNFGKGPMIVSVRGTRVALGRDEANSVLVDLSAAGEA